MKRIATLLKLVGLGAILSIPLHVTPLKELHASFLELHRRQMDLLKIEWGKPGFSSP